MKNSKLLLGLLIVLAVSCSGDKSFEVVSLDSMDENDDYMMDRIESMTVIPLETTPKALVGNDFRLYVTDDGFYLVDVFGESPVHRFDKDGHYLNDIGMLGNGPGEYGGVSGINVSRGVVSVFTAPFFKILNYTTEGNYIDTVDWGELYNVSAIKYRENYYLYQGYGLGDENSRLLEISGDGTGQKKLLYSDISTLIITDNHPFSICGDNLIIKDIIHDTKYVLDYGTNAIPRNLFFEKDEMKAAQEFMSRDILSLQSYYESERYVFMDFEFRQIEEFKLVRLVKDKLQNTWTKVIYDEDDEEIFNSSLKYASYDNVQFYLINKEKLKDINDKYRQYIQGVDCNGVGTEEDNPVILQVTFRKQDA